MIAATSGRRIRLLCDYAIHTVAKEALFAGVCRVYGIAIDNNNNYFYAIELIADYHLSQFSLKELSYVYTVEPPRITKVFGQQIIVT